jgi:hypothetical protein
MATDFSKMLKEIRELGYDDYELEKLIGVERTRLSHLRVGRRKTINYDDGVKIVEFYQKKFKTATKPKS